MWLLLKFGDSVAPIKVQSDSYPKMASALTNPTFADIVAGKQTRLIPPTRQGEEGKSEPVPKVFDERVMMMRTKFKR